MLHALILAGGSGTRLWPASRIAQPKHLLAFESPPNQPGRTLLQATFERLSDLVPPDQIWIVTNQSQAASVACALPRFNAAHIWAEPHTRNTAASIGWAAVKLRHIDPDAVMVVLPADHIINPASIFCDMIQCAADIVAISPEKLVTIGVKPTFPATSYGYIQRGTAFETFPQTTSTRLKKGNYCGYCVHQFCEKPNRETAESFCQSGEFYWNAGIFVWKAETILDLLNQFEPDIGMELRQIEQSLGKTEETLATEIAFKNMKSISIDYAVMERAENVLVLESAFEWNDVGTWTALDRLYANQKDKDGNIAVDSRLLAINSTGCTVRCDDSDHLIALVGLHDVVVIQTADATLIVSKNQEESVRHIGEELKKQDLSQWS